MTDQKMAEFAKAMLDIIRRLHIEVKAQESVIVEHFKAEPKSVPELTRAAKKKPYIKSALDSRYDVWTRSFDLVAQRDLHQATQELLERIRRELGQV